MSSVWGRVRKDHSCSVNFMFLCIASQVWQKAGVFFHHGLTVSHCLNPGRLRQLGHVLCPQLSKRTWPSLQLWHIAHTGWERQHTHFCRSQKSPYLSLNCSIVLNQWIQYVCRQFDLHVHVVPHLNAVLVFLFFIRVWDVGPVCQDEIRSASPRCMLRHRLRLVAALCLLHTRLEDAAGSFCHPRIDIYSNVVVSDQLIRAIDRWSMSHITVTLYQTLFYLKLLQGTVVCFSGSSCWQHENHHLQSWRSWSGEHVYLFWEWKKHKVWYWSPEWAVFHHGFDGTECWAEVNKHNSDVANSFLENTWNQFVKTKVQS